MATSGSINYTQSRVEVIRDAYSLLNVYGEGRTISDADMKLANSLLNKMVKAWQARGLHLWTKEEAYVFLEKGVARYVLSGDASSAKAALTTGSVLTTMTTAAAASATTLVVGSTTGMTAADNIGIELDSGEIHWDTIASVDSATGLTLDTGIVTAAGASKNVYTFTTRINKPLRILSVRRKTDIGTDSTAIPMVPLSHSEYFDLPSKDSNGLSNHYYYNPDLTTGSLYVWPRPEDTGIHLEITFERMIEDLDAAGDNFDFPSEWLECLTYQLAVRLAPAFGKEQKAAALIVPLATDMYQELLSWDSEVTSLYLMPDSHQ